VWCRAHQGLELAGDSAVGRSTVHRLMPEARLFARDVQSDSVVCLQSSIALQRMPASKPLKQSKCPSLLISSPRFQRRLDSQWARGTELLFTGHVLSPSLCAPQTVLPASTSCAVWSDWGGDAACTAPASRLSRRWRTSAKRFLSRASACADCQVAIRRTPDNRREGLAPFRATLQCCTGERPACRDCIG